MESASFAFISDLVKKRCGLVLPPDKSYLLESRLLPVARLHHCKTVAALIDLAREGEKEPLLRDITEAMTTNESSFFRDGKPFDYFRKQLLPALAKEKKEVRIWSAACSTGQEPYSIAMCLQEEAPRLEGMKAEIIATDLAVKVLLKAKGGKYSQFEIQRGLPIQMLMKYFNQLADTSWQLKEDVRRKVIFREHNLLGDYAPLGKFDVVFCRNVLIYFDEAVRIRVVQGIAQLLNPGGYLLLGSTEALLDKGGIFEDIKECRGLYRLK